MFNNALRSSVTGNLMGSTMLIQSSTILNIDVQQYSDNVNV